MTRNTKILLYLLLAAMTTACEEPLSGDDAVRVSFDTPATKASFGAGGRIDWTAGDRVEVFADASAVTNRAGGASAVYIIGTPSAVGTQSRASARPEGQGLFWAAGATGARFYGRFPPRTSTGGSSGLFEGLIIPQVQAYSNPADLSFAPMVAGPSVVERPASVSLAFRAVYTTFDIRLSSTGDAIAMKEVALLSPTKALWGIFAFNAETGNFACPARTPLNGVLAMDLSGQTVPEGGALSATLLLLPHAYDDLALRVKYDIDGEEQVATLPLSYGGTPLSFAPCERVQLSVTPLSDGGWHMNVASGLTVADWTLRGDHAINYDATVEVAQGFTFSSTEYDNVDVTVDDQAWTVTLDKASSVAYVTFRISSPVGADWIVQKVDPEGWFLLDAISGDIAGAPRGVIDGSTVTLRLRPNPAAVPATRSADYSIILHTYVEVGTRSYNIDTETQNLEHYDYARFIIPAND